MLRVTRSDEGEKTSLKLEGKLAGSWVEVVEQCWRQAVAESQELAISVDLTAVAYVDERGIELLAQMHLQGVELRASTCLGKGIVEQIKSRSGEPVQTRQ